MQVLLWGNGEKINPADKKNNSIINNIINTIFNDSETMIML